MNTFSRRIFYTWFIVCVFVKEYVCVKNVEIKTNSWLVIFKHNVTLHCSFELEKDEVLLSVNWYRGNQEFYRYRPSDLKPMRTFSLYSTKVDPYKSNKTHVTLLEVGYELDGNVKCEVTPDPNATYSYKMKSAVVRLQVISPPEKPPVITTDKTTYKVNDTLLANCTSSLSYPSSSLSFLLNNEPVGTPSKDIIHCNQSHSNLLVVLCKTSNNRTTWTWLPLELRLEKKHFKDEKIILKCTGIVANTTYRSETETTILLSSNEPKSQRVQSSTSIVHCHSLHYQVILISAMIVWLIL